MTTAASAASAASPIDLTLGGRYPTLLRDVREYWFEGVSAHALAPDSAAIKRWFTRDEDNDRYCRQVNTYLPILHEIGEQHAPQQLQDDSRRLIADPTRRPLDTLSMILLLDQIARNCFRGPESGVVFRVYDGLARDLALRALFPVTYRRWHRPATTAAAGDPPSPLPRREWYDGDHDHDHDHDHPLDISGDDARLDELPLFRYHLGYRMWFYLPLMHSESRTLHAWLAERFQSMRADLDGLQPSGSSTPPRTEQDLQAARGMAAFNAKFAREHRDIIERFGRYPHRNEALGRPSTAEEEHYLKNGGLTFASG
ncbi:MAG: hypothetical protein M1826_007634 [Phylliscum demangeonii]|nr:MAG: hypothetical protein M1826_007634 [Phylliscum demangeonii]